jgi:K+-transporting ATPase ATPase A chain
MPTRDLRGTPHTRFQAKTEYESAPFRPTRLFGRYVPLLAALALAGAVATKRTVPASAGTFRTDGPTFSILLIGVIVLTAGLMILPALTLGPIVEGLSH